MTENQIMVVQAADITDFIIENDKLIKYNGTGSYVEIPENVTIIGRNAFSDCSSLMQVKISKGVTMIENCAFQNYNNLSDIEIPVSITTIESLAFSGYENLIVVKEGISFRLCNADIGIGCSVSGSVSGNWLFNNKFKINGDTDFKINIKMNGKVKTYKVKVKVKK